MNVWKSAGLGLALAVLGAGGALAAEEMACCKDKKPCCEQMKDGKPMPCCDGHKTEAPKPDAPKPPAGEHQHQH